MAPSNAKMLLLSSLVQHLRAQKSIQDTPKSVSNSQVGPQLPQATELAKILTENPKLMIELAIELTKLAQKDI